MTNEECVLCDLPLAQCVHGLPKGKQTLDLPVVVGPTIEANTFSPCEECGEKITPGESITYTDLGWIHDHHEMVRKDERPDNPGNLMEGL